MFSFKLSIHFSFNLPHWRVYYAVESPEGQPLTDDYVYIEVYRHEAETLMGCTYCTLPIIRSEVADTLFDLTPEQLKALVYRKGIGNSLVPMLPTAEGEVQVTKWGKVREEVKNFIPKPTKFDWRMGGCLVTFDVKQKTIHFLRNFYYDPLDKDVLTVSKILEVAKYNGWQHSSKEIDKHDWERHIFDDQVKISDIKDKNNNLEYNSRKWLYFCPIYFDTWTVFFEVNVAELTGAKDIFYNTPGLKGKNFNNDKAGAILMPYTEKPEHMTDENWEIEKRNWYSAGFDMKASTVNPENIDWTHELGHHWGLENDLWSWQHITMPEYYPKHNKEDDIPIDDEIASIMSYSPQNKKIMPWDIRYLVENRLAGVRDIQQAYPTLDKIVLKKNTWIQI